MTTKNDKDQARVDGPIVTRDVPDTASVNETKGATAPLYSPLPWRWTPCEVEGNDTINGAMLYSGDASVFSVDCGDWYGLSDDTARFICLAVNQHHALVAALTRIAESEEECGCLHDDENCCNTAGVFCTRCIAAMALAECERRGPP